MVGGEYVEKQETVLQGVFLNKRFAGVHAVQDVSIELQKGEILGLVGENGAGKSTLLKLLVCEHEKDSGEIYFKGEQVHWSDSYEALMGKVGLIHQRPSLVPDLTAAQNIFLGKEVTHRGMLSDTQICKDAKKLLEAYPINPDFDLSMPVHRMTAGQREVTEILRVLSYEPEVLILDEPTASLTKEESIQLMRILRRLNRENGLSIIHISHRMEEVFDFCTRILVLRNGKRIGTVDKDHFDKKKIIHMIINRDLNEFFPPKEGRTGETLLQVNDVTSEQLDHVTIDLKAGEIVGLYGLSGAGMTDLVETVFGIKRFKSGEVIIRGESFSTIHPTHIIKKHVFLVPEDRDTKGLFTKFSVKDNLMIAHLSSLLPKGLIRRKKESEIARNGVKRFAIKCSGLNQEIRSLSGGNQQKVVIAKWLMEDCDVLMLDDPTAGVDVGTKREVYLILRELTKAGKGVVLVSSDILEIIGMSDRVYTMRDGAISAEIPKPEITQANILEHVL